MISKKNSMADFDGTQKEIFSRLEGLFETDILQKKLVTIIGLGSGGSLCAIELAKCSVGNFRLVDFDNLQIHNIARHACGLSDVGRKKTDAVKDAILNINPYANVECFDFDILRNHERLEAAIDGSDLVLPCTDTEESKYVVNKMIMMKWHHEKKSIPAVYAGAYERAFGGDIMRVIPGETPCYDCVVGAVQKMSIVDSKPKSKVDYSNLENSDGFKAEPGLGLDVHFIVLIQAKLALLTLLRDTTSELEDIEYHFIMWGNRKEWIFTEPLKSIFANIEKRPDCVTCGHYEQSEVSKDMHDDIEERAKNLIDSLTTVTGIEDLIEYDKC